MRVISLFCGCGGMDLGLAKSGHKIVWANDNDKDSILTYTDYFTRVFKSNKEHIVCDDIYNVDTKDIFALLSLRPWMMSRRKNDSASINTRS